MGWSWNSGSFYGFCHSPWRADGAFGTREPLGSTSPCWVLQQPLPLASCFKEQQEKKPQQQKLLFPCFFLGYSIKKKPFSFTSLCSNTIGLEFGMGLGGRSARKC